MIEAATTSRSRWVNINTLLGVFWLVAALVFLFYLVPNHIDEAPMVDNPMQSPRWLPSVATAWGCLP